MATRDQMRAADGDRERVAERVRQALDEGRLTLDELDERLRQVYQAKTFGELDRIVADLPPLATPAESQLTPAAKPLPSRIEANPKLPTWLSYLWRLWLVVVLINLVIWFIVSVTAGKLVYFWPIWVAGPWAAVNIGLSILFPPRRR
jgi:Na+/melibiose symporter-like transporter